MKTLDQLKDEYREVVKKIDLPHSGAETVEQRSDRTQKHVGVLCAIMDDTFNFIEQELKKKP